MLYAIITLKGFKTKEDGSIATYDTAHDATKHMESGNAIIPIRDEEKVAAYEAGELPTPSVNRSGRGV